MNFILTRTLKKCLKFWVLDVGEYFDLVDIIREFILNACTRRNCKVKGPQEIRILDLPHKPN